MFHNYLIGCIPKAPVGITAPRIWGEWGSTYRMELAIPRFGDDNQLDACGTRTNHVNRTGGGAGEIDHAVVNEWSAIVDADLSGLSVIEIVNADPGAERKSLVSSRELVHVINFTARGFLALVTGPVPTGDAGFDGSNFGRGNLNRSSAATCGEWKNGGKQQHDHGTAPFGYKTILAQNVFGRHRGPDAFFS